MKNAREVVERRQQSILQMLSNEKSIKVKYLADQLCVTTTTIRRDLAVLEERGYIQKHFGGASYALPPNADVQYLTPKGNPTPKRLAIAEYAAQMISDGDIVFLNSSSTALYILDYLYNISVTIVTNNGRAIYAKREPGVDLVLTGGEVFGKKQSLVGEFAINSLKGVVANKCFLGASGISITSGVTSSIVQEIAVNKQMVNQCNGPRVIVADSSKIGVRQSFFSFGLEEVTHLVTDGDADPRELDALREKGIQVIIVS